jgi:ketosteroid isomerase-like protein
MPADPSSPAAVLERLHDAMNCHDPEAFVACFHPDYRSEQPRHPERAFVGTEQVRHNWSALFRSLPDFRADRVRSAIQGEEVWAEWSWEGTQESGERLVLQGVTVFGVAAGRIRWGRLYMEPVQEAGEETDARVGSLTGGSPAG